LFRHGSFYNLFDVDADVGMSVGLAPSGERKANMQKVAVAFNAGCIFFMVTNKGIISRVCSFC